MLNRMFTYIALKSARQVRGVAVATSGALFAGLMVTVGATPSVGQAVDPTVLCGMCLTEPSVLAVSLTDSSKVTVNGGGLYVNSNALPAVSLAVSAKIVTIAQVRAVGSIVKTGSSSISGTPAAGLVGPLFADPYPGRALVISVAPNDSTVDHTQSGGGVIPARVDSLYRDVSIAGSGTVTFPDAHRYRDVTVGGSVSATLKPGLYRNMTFSGSSKITFMPGAYWLAGSLNATISSKITGANVSLVLACGTETNDLRACNNETGGRLFLSGSSQLTLNGNTPTTPAISFAPGNNAGITVEGSSKLTLTNSGIDAPNAPIAATSSSSISTAGVIYARRVTVTGSSTITTTVIPPPPPSTSTTVASSTTSTTTTVPELVVSASVVDIPAIDVAPNSQSFLGLTSPSKSFSVSGVGDSLGASVSVTLSESLPPQAVSVSRDLTTFLPYGVAASAVFDFDLAGDQSVLTSANISLPIDSQLLGSTDPANLWMAYQDEASGFWLPEENAPVVDSSTGVLTVTTSHFSKRVLLKDRPISGAWTNQFLDSMFGPFPAQCVPAGTPGLTPFGRIAFIFDSSGSMGVSADLKAATISQRIAAELRPQDRPGVFSVDGNGRSGGLLAPGWTNQALSLRIADASKGFGGLNHLMNGPDIKSILEIAESSLASSADVLRHIYLFTDYDGVRSLISPAEIASAVPLSLSETLNSYGIRLTIVAFPSGDPLGTEWSNPSANIKIVVPGPATGLDLANDLRKQSGRLVDDGLDPDGDGLTTCEEGALFFPNPNFPGGSTRNPTGQIATYDFGVVSYNAPSVFFSQTNPQPNPVALRDGFDTDKDGTSDGSEISRRKISASPALSRAFANLLSQGVDLYFVAVTGRPDSVDTDGDTLGDPTAPAKTETCSTGAPSPLLADSDGDNVRDDQECANGTDPNINPVLPANRAKAIPWIFDYTTAQTDLDKLEGWRGSKVQTGMQTFIPPAGMAKYGRVRIDGFIPQDKTATTPCLNNQRPVGALAIGTYVLEECTGYIGDNRPYSPSYESHRNLYLPFNRYILDVDFKNGVWAMLTHPTCSRDATASTGACFDSFPIYRADLSGYENLNVFGSQQKQLVDFRVDPTTKKVSVSIAVVQNDNGLAANLFRPAADAKFVFELLSDRMQLKVNADAFPAAEGFWIPPTGPTQVAFNTDSFFGLAPSPLALLGSGFLANLLNFPPRIFGSCYAPDVPNATKCVPSSFSATVNLFNG